VYNLSIIHFFTRNDNYTSMKLTLLILPLLFSLFWNVALADDKRGYVLVDEQVQITSDLTNSQDRIQNFVYIVQLKDDQGVSISLAWITGALSPNQRLSPALSWTPDKAGMYTAEIFVWESINNPDALSPPLHLNIEVREKIEQG